MAKVDLKVAAINASTGDEASRLRNELWWANREVAAIQLPTSDNATSLKLVTHEGFRVPQWTQQINR